MSDSNKNLQSHLSEDPQNQKRLVMVRQWISQPWNQWIQSPHQSLWLDLFSRFFCILPMHVIEKVFLTSEKPFIFLPPVHGGRLVDISQMLKHGAFFLQLDARAMTSPTDEALALLAHEVAHAFAPPTNNSHENDLIADRLVVDWGLGFGLKSALSKELATTHPRLTQLKAV